MGKLHVIAGPTASGKTSAAINLAKQIDGEVISADSMQVYKYMDIGTAKPTVQEMDGIPHHLLDVALPSQPFSVADYVQLAETAIQDITARGKVPILAGGTGFYINAVINGTTFDTGESGLHEQDNQLREEFTALAYEKGAEYIHEKLQAVDPSYAENVHPNNVKKVARALSFFHTTGKQLSMHNASQKSANPKYNASFCVLHMPREVLYDRINTRVIAMWDAGLPQEVENLLASGYHANLTAMQGIGYKETIPYLQGRMSKEETIAQIQQNTRNYAKRQETWFRHQAKGAKFISKDDITCFTTI